MKHPLLALLGALLSLAFSFAHASSAVPPVSRDLPPGLQIPADAKPGPNFDVDRATESYLNLLTPEQRALSDNYFEGGYWLELWGFLYGIVVAALLLASRTSARMRDIARRISARPWLQTMIYTALWVLVGALLAFPWTVYTDFVREHQYGLATQNFGAWFVDALKGLIVSLVVVPPLIALAYAAVRRAGRQWWVWASLAAFVVILFVQMFEPVFVEPLFNDYKPLREGDIRQAVLSLARANQIPTDNVVEFDASRQTTRLSANVSGFLSTTRVALNDNLIEKSSLPEVKAVMGHEMGHYVLNHGLRGAVYFTLLIAFGFWFVNLTFDRALARWGARFGVENRADPAGLPLAVALFSLFAFLTTPLANSIVRQAEAEADMFGLDAAREPHGFAMAAMRLSTYRKIHPGALEEVIFYDHPSGYARVHGSMLWLKENQDNPTANAAK